MSDEQLPDYARANRKAWDGWADQYANAAHRNWSETDPTWGIWRIPQSTLPFLPTDIAGLDAIELGCGTAYVCARMARLGARPVGIDNSPRQLETAREMQAEFGIEFPLLLGNAESVPYPDASFDLVVSEYGAATWCDPYKWIPEAARLLRPGGRLIFMCNSTLLMLCAPDEGASGDRLLRDEFGLHRLDWPDGESDFHLPHGEWIRVMRTAGFDIEDLVEVQAPAGAETNYDFVTAEWARHWPSEEIWRARKRH